MPRIKIEVKENIATNLTPEIEIVSNNGDYEIEFSFDSLWDSSSVKTARFYYNFSHTDIVFDGNVCQVPPLYETQLLKVGVFTDTNKTTTDAEIKCRFSIKKYGGNVHEPTEDVYAQIMALLNKYIEQGGGVETPDLSDYQKKTDETLETGSKEVVGAINELNSESVKNTQFANYSDSGIVQGYPSSMRYFYQAGKLYLEGATESDLKDRKKYIGLTPRELDDILRIGLTTNTKTLTDEEKTSACGWIGAVGKNDVSKPSDGSNPDRATLGLTKYLYPDFGGLSVDANGLVKVHPETNPKAKRQPYYNVPITAYYFNPFVKEALCGENNPLVLTEEEKQKVRQLLGIE